MNYVPVPSISIPREVYEDLQNSAYDQGVSFKFYLFYLLATSMYRKRIKIPLTENTRKKYKLSRLEGARRASNKTKF